MSAAHSFAHVVTPLLNEFTVLGLEPSQRRTKAIRLNEIIDTERMPALGYILAESLGRDIQLFEESNKKSSFQKLPVPLKLDNLPFTKRLSYGEADVHHALGQFLDGVFIDAPPVSCAPQLHTFGQFLQTRNIPFSMPYNKGNWDVIIDAPARIVADTDFRAAVSELQDVDGFGMIVIRPSEQTSHQEIIRIAGEFGYDAAQVKIDPATHVFAVQSSIDDLMDPTNRNKRDQLYATARIATGYSNDPQATFDIVSHHERDHYFVVGIPSADNDALPIVEVPVAAYPSTVWSHLHTGDMPMIAKGKAVTPDTIEEVAKHLASAFQVTLEARRFRDENGLDALKVVFQEENERPAAELKVAQLLQQAITFASLRMPLEIEHSVSAVAYALTKELSELPCWVQKKDGRITLLSGAEAFTPTECALMRSALPTADIKFGEVSKIVNAEKTPIATPLAAAYAVEIEQRLQMVFGFGKASPGSTGILLQLPQRCRDSEPLMSEIEHISKQYPFPMAMVFDQQYVQRQWSKENLCSLFDGLSKPLVPVEIASEDGGWNITLCRQAPNVQHAPKLIDALRDLVGKPLKVTYTGSLLFVPNSGIDPVMVRQLKAKASGKAFERTSPLLEQYGQNVSRYGSDLINPHFEPCGEVLTCDDASKNFDTAFAVQRLNEEQVRIQLFVADVASYVLPGSYAEYIALARLKSRYDMLGERLWNELLPTSLVQKASLQEGKHHRCFVFDAIVHCTEDPTFTFEGFTVADVPVSYNHHIKGLLPVRYQESFEAYQQVCHAMGLYRDKHGSARHGYEYEEAVLSEPTHLVNHLAAMVAQKEQVPFLYQELSTFYREMRAEDILSALNSARVSSGNPAIWKGISERMVSDRIGFAAELEKILQSLIHAGQGDIAAELQRSIVGRADNSTTPVRSQIGTGFELSGRIAPGLRNVSALINQSQLLAHFLGVPPRSEKELNLLIKELQTRGQQIDSMIRRIESGTYKG